MPGNMVSIPALFVGGTDGDVLKRTRAFTERALTCKEPCSITSSRLAQKDCAFCKVMKPELPCDWLMLVPAEQRFSRAKIAITAGRDGLLSELP